MLNFLEFFRSLFLTGPWGGFAGGFIFALLLVFAFHQWFWKSVLERDRTLLEQERDLHKNKRLMLSEVLREHEYAQEFIEDLQDRLAAAESMSVPDGPAFRALSAISKPCDLSTGTVPEMLVAVWQQAGMAIGYSLRWRPLFRRRRIQRLVKLAVSDEPQAPRRKSDAAIFYVLKAAVDAAKVYSVATMSSLLPTYTVQFLKDPEATDEGLAQYVVEKGIEQATQTMRVVEEEMYNVMDLGIAMGIRGLEPEHRAEPGDEKPEGAVDPR